MDANQELAKRLQAEEEGELSIEERSNLFVELINQRKKHFARLRSEEKRRKPPTGKHGCSFVPMDKEVVEGSETRSGRSSKRAGEELESDKSKKQMLDEKVEAEEGNDQKEAQMKMYMKIVSDDEVAIDAIPLETKPPITVDWKIIKEGKIRKERESKENSNETATRTTRGVIIREASETTTRPTIPPQQKLDPKDKGELKEKEMLARQKKEEANIALITECDDVQAMMDANQELAKRLQAEEEGELSIEERSNLFVELINQRKKHFVEAMKGSRVEVVGWTGEEEKWGCEDGGIGVRLWWWFWRWWRCVVASGVVDRVDRSGGLSWSLAGNLAGDDGRRCRRGLGHLARNCTVRPRRRDAAYLQTQQASTLGTQSDKAPIYDSNRSAEVQLHDTCYDDEIFNMFTQAEQYTELLELIPEPHQVLQNNSNVTYVVSSVEQNGGTIEEHLVNVEETRIFLASKDETTPVLKTILIGLENLLSLKVKETLHVHFVENKPNVAGSGPAWLFDIDSLTRTMNYHPVIAENQTNSHADAFVDGKEHDDDIQKSVSFDIHSSSSGAQTRDLNAEFEECTNNSRNGVNAASSSVSTAGHNFINSTNGFSAAGPSNAAASPTATNSSSQDASTSTHDSDMPNLEDLTHSDDADDVDVWPEQLEIKVEYHRCLMNTFILACLLVFFHKRSPNECIKLSRIQVRLKPCKKSFFSSKVQKVWILVDLPYGKRAIGTKWVTEIKRIKEA
nr:ribonuclease H-like domain-containing protein [Tanacetum cinerariifolium]